MAAGRPRGHGASKSFGVGWLQDQLRARFDIRGPIGEPFDIAPEVQVGMEARPSLPWEYGNARWPLVAGANAIGTGGVGTFASCTFSTTLTGRALVLDRIVGASDGNVLLGLYVNQAFVAGNVGFGLRDGGLTAGGVGGSWITPVPDAASIVQNVAVALPAPTGRIMLRLAPALTSSDFEGPFILRPGQSIVLFSETANVGLYAYAMGYLVPLNDIT